MISTTHYKQATSTGFTLIETIIYIGLTTLIIGSLLTVVYQIVESTTAVAKKVMLEQEVNFLFQKIKFVLMNNQNINTPVLGTSGTILSVNKINSLENPFIFDLDSGNIRLKRGLNNPIILNSQNITISNLSFEYIPASLGVFEAIKVSMTINAKILIHSMYLRK